MIYLIHGSDSGKARAKMRALRDALAAKKPDAALVRIDTESFEAALVDELSASTGLFESRSIVILDHVLASREAKEAVAERLGAMASSPNVFVMLEGEIDAATLGKIGRHAEKIQEFSAAVPKRKKEKALDFFTLADALGRRDRRSFWVLYRRAVAAGASAEELHGILFWQVKSMMLAAGSDGPKAAGLNPFVFRKAKSFAGNFSKGELSALSSKLVRLYHDAHRGTADFETELELLALTI